jgi:hypothetical protein
MPENADEEYERAMQEVERKLLLGLYNREIAREETDLLRAARAARKLREQQLEEEPAPPAPPVPHQQTSRTSSGSEVQDLSWRMMIRAACAYGWQEIRTAIHSIGLGLCRSFTALWMDLTEKYDEGSRELASFSAEQVKEPPCALFCCVNSW